MDPPPKTFAKLTMGMDYPSYLIWKRTGESPSEEKFQYLIKSFYNENCETFLSKDYVYILQKPSFTTGLSKMKEKFTAIFTKVEIFKSYFTDNVQKDIILSWNMTT
jgi:hypothetical protein